MQTLRQHLRAIAKFCLTGAKQPKHTNALPLPLRWLVLKYLGLATVIALSIFCTEAALAAVTITRTSSPIFYMDDEESPALRGMYTSYTITNTGGALNDVWVKIDLPAFGTAGRKVTRGQYEDGIVQLGPMAAGETKTAFFYVDTPEIMAGQNSSLAISESHNVIVYNTRPDLPTATQLGTGNFSFTEIQDTIAANANKVTQTTVSSGQLGGNITVTVTGDAGTIGSPPNQSFSPATYGIWPADTFELVSSSVTYGSQSFSNQLSFSSSPASTSYTATYVFRIRNTTTTSTPLSPIGEIASGNQIKHTSTGNFGSLAPIPPISNNLQLSKSVSSTQLSTGGTVTYTLRLTNTGTKDVVVQDIVDTLPSTPAAATYITNTAKYNNVAIADPNISGSKLTWVASFSVPAGATRDLTYQVSIPNTQGTYTNSAIAHIGSAQIDTTLDTSDNAPATANVSVSTPASLTVTKNTSTPNVTAGGTANYTITVSNVVGSGTATNVNISDTLPGGFTYASTGTPTLSAGATRTSTTNPTAGATNPSWGNFTIPAGGSVSIPFTVNVGSGVSAGTYQNPATANYTNPSGTSGIASYNSSSSSQEDVTVTPTYSVSGTLYQDSDGNNTFNNEPSLPTNITVKLLDSAGTTTLTTTTTNASGQYNFIGIANGSYKIQVDTTDSDIPVGYVLTTSNNVAVTISGANISNINFGFQSPKISGYKSVKLTNDADSSTTVTQGDTLNWTLSYANTGSIDVSNFQVTDALPSGVTIAGTPTISANATQGTAPTANTSYNGTGTNTLFSLPVTLKAGGVITATIPVTIDSGVTGIKSNQATGNGTNLLAGINTDNIDNTTTGLPASVTVPTNSINQTQTASSDPTTVNVSALAADLSITKTDNKTNVNQGSPTTYTIAVTNNGSITVNNIKVTDTVPASIQSPTFTPSTGSYNSSTGDWTGLNLASGQSVTLTLSGTVSSTATGTITNTATVTPPTGTTDPDSSNNSSTDTTTVNPATDLSITKTDSADPVNAGANLTYTIAVTNNGSSTASNVTMSDALPSGTTFQSITVPSGWNCTTPAVGTNGTINCTNSSFAVGSANFTVVVKVDPNTANATSINNTATVSSSTVDTNTGNNSSSQTTTVQQSADLELTKVANPASPSVGSIFDYIITVTNDGPSAATNVKVKDQLPTGIIYDINLLDTPSQGTYSRITGEWVVGTLNPGASATLTIRAIRNATGSTVNTAEVIAADQPDPDSPHNNNVSGEDDQDSVSVPSQSVDLAVTKTVDKSTPTVGQNVTFTVTVTNPLSSTDTATGVGLTDVLPTGLTYQSHTVSTGTYNSSSGVWNVGTLNSGTTATLTIIATVTTSGAKTNTAQLSALDQTDTNTGNNTASATVTASSSTPQLSLVKRITAINDNRTQNPNDGTRLDEFVNDTSSTLDDDPNWYNRNTYLKGAIDGGKVKPGDEVEYTIYFLNNQAPAMNVTICDLIPTHETFVSTGYNTASPHPTEAGALASDTGLALALDENTLPTNPTFYLTNTNDSDRGRYYPPNDPSTPSGCRQFDAQNNLISSGSAANTNGAIVVKVVRGTGTADRLPPATAPGTPSNSYGFVRFKAKVN